MYAKHNFPVLLDCNFIIDHANGNGLGQRSLKGPGIDQVFGNTSATPATFNGITNNMPAGYFQIFLQSSYTRYFGGFSGFVTQLSGSNISISSGLSVGTVYVIVSVGTSTAANWQAVGLPQGITPAVGVAFVASSASAGTGTGVVQVPNANGSGIADLEVVGDPNTTINPSGVVPLTRYIIVRTMNGGASPVATAPADNSVLGLTLYLSNSSVLVAGE